MIYCKRCLYPENHPLKILFDEDGICSGCRVHEEKYLINWDEKKQELNHLVKDLLKNAHTHYDCIIPVVGTGDDFFVVDHVKNNLKLNPLLVTYNHHFSTKIGIRNLSRLITKLDCDHLMSTVGPDTIKAVTKITFQKLGDIYWHVLAGSQTFPVQVATKLGIPLIIWGVNGWLDQVGKFSHHDVVEMTKKIRKEHALRGLDAESLIGSDPNITQKDLQPFTYPSDEQLERSRVRGIYLGNYLFWDSQNNVESMIEKYGYETASQERTYNTYETIHCWNNSGVHDYIKFLKFGYGKVTDHASRDIRLKKITREEGIELVRKYQDVKPRSLDLFLNWIGMTELELFEGIDAFRDPKIWTKRGSEWCLIDSVIHHKDDLVSSAFDLADASYRPYIRTDLAEAETHEYHLSGRGYFDEGNYKAIEG